MPTFRNRTEDDLLIQQEEVVDYKEVSLDTETTPGLVISADSIEVNENDDTDYDRLYSDYEDMRRNGAISEVLLSSLKQPIINAGYTIERKNDDPLSILSQQYIQWCFDELIDGYQDFIYHDLLALDYGVQFFEKVQQNNVKFTSLENKTYTTNIIKRLSPIQLTTIKEWVYNDMQDFVGFDMDVYGGSRNGGINNRKLIPRAKMYFHTHNEEYRDIRGNSEYRPIQQTYRDKRSLKKAMLRAANRGAGIPEVKINSSKPGLASKARTIGKTLGNAENCYVVTNEDIDIELHELKNQDKNLDFLEFLNREMFFNFLSQFMTSGIGQNGSRASTSEHKSAYEMKLNAIVRETEYMINRKLVRDMYNISFLANIPDENKAEFKINTVSQMDIKNVVDSATALYDQAVMRKLPGDELFFRDLLGMPEEKAVIENEEEEEQQKDEAELTHCGCGSTLELSGKERKRNMSLEMQEYEAKVFELESATEHFLTTQEKAQAVIDDVQNKLLQYYGKKLEKDIDADLEVKFDIELANRLNAVYREGADRGKRDARKELAKIGKASVSLQDDKKLKSVSKKIKKQSIKLITDISTGAERLVTNNKKALLSGTKEIPALLATTKDFFKRQKRDLITDTQEGYSVGRAEELFDPDNAVNIFVYTAILDTNLCDTCAPLDGLTFTREEIEASDLNDSSPVNPGCLGQDKCRCQWIALEKVLDEPEKAKRPKKLPKGVLNAK